MDINSSEGVQQVSMDSLCAAAANGDTKGVSALLAQGADPNGRSSEGFAPLCIASFWGSAGIVQLLLRHGADVNCTNTGTGWTPCHCAAFQGHGKVLMHLMEESPDLTLKDNAGRTAVDFGSALDSVWPFFAASGCVRTCKEDLIEMNIVKKAPPVSAEMEKAAALQTAPYLRPHFSRPGSAYVLQMQPLAGVKETKAAAKAAVYGDVLSEDPAEVDQSTTAISSPGNPYPIPQSGAPSFTPWRT